ncbi:MaoC/PaaZ C-terminal domain-containing protein [Mycobacterium sp. CVI_P3]|uniref:MaoC/PaaZ C-terminal domain-containing protein n=1 Tax=Mycobacterium pinniadriaticum TaxID=2994102 RepID=A0ABT3SC45_9MYCO|nr:MaoC/PaaZ C-terminal domain-containing protein [Mycobacterium pinniadriaticum]MCX2930625.1 MaoC/PaaZ C-terminal domain-containing protein [Mycobacterium pinniadriaticum]MCX2937049.1 MaoC/PaaZ C-terminal domain-containing protein [Mycobacterium pinniadriaticum]
MTTRLSSAAVTVGAALPDKSFGPQSHTDIVRYQGASGDFNPVHHDPEFAKKSGAPGVLSVGMLQAGYLGTYCVALFGPESVRRLAVRFAEQVWPGDELVCRGSVTAVDRTSDPGTAELELSIRRAGGGVAVSGTATVALAAIGTDGRSMT